MSSTSTTVTQSKLFQARSKLIKFFHMYFNSIIGNNDFYSKMCTEMQFTIQTQDSSIKVEITKHNQPPVGYSLYFVPIIQGFCNASQTLKKLISGVKKNEPLNLHEPWQFGIDCSNPKLLDECIKELQTKALSGVAAVNTHAIKNNPNKQIGLLKSNGFFGKFAQNAKHTNIDDQIYEDKATTTTFNPVN